MNTPQITPRRRSNAGFDPFHSSTRTAVSTNRDSGTGLVTQCLVSSRMEMAWAGDELRVHCTATKVMTVAPDRAQAAARKR